ncbi:hypothetical protein [Actinomadura xylanilytica]|uniref:hypothetical protein n=1 Tax=Actinomadura xylanilytica TaxID=887459 RepID=UPI00255AB260|nr:hypothetical protein [Actinomadura xylanilytica]MDL4776112.1 hypothetical protein [Actinomadura xylanilytica]
MNRNLPFIAAPLLATVYGLVRLVDGIGGRGPGFFWTAGHAAFLAALVLFVPALLEMRRRAGRGGFATVTAVVGIVGIGFAMAQIGIDIIVGVLATDDAHMQRMFHDVQSVPGVGLAVYEAGPPLFYLGLLAAMIHLAVVRVVPVWAPVVLTLGVVVSMVDLDLLPLAGLLMTAALVPLVRPVRVPAHA